jgi:osmotically-inducible protein OsmY
VQQTLTVKLLTISCFLIGSLGFVSAQQQTEGQAANPNADNTKANKQDRSQNEPTADQAKDNSSDREIMRRIRKSVVSDKSLSTDAHNVKIISQGGKVTLRGPVDSEDEKNNVEQKATEVAGAGNVTNDITVKGEQTGAGAHDPASSHQDDNK